MTMPTVPMTQGIQPAPVNPATQQQQQQQQTVVPPGTAEQAPVTTPGTSVPDAGARSTATQTDPGQQQNQFDPNKNIWDPTPAKNPTDPQAPNAAATQPTTAAEPITFDKYLEGFNPGFDISRDVMATALETGDFTAFNEHLNTTMRNFAGQLIQENFRLAQGAVDKATAALKTDITTDFQVSASQASLEASFTLAKDPNFAPVAQAAKGAFLKDGLTDEQANQAVAEFFTHIAKKHADASGQSIVPLDENPYNRPQGASGQEPTDWAALLQGAPPTT